MTTRDVVVAGALPRHQMRQYLRALQLEWQEIRGNTKVSNNECTFRVKGATEAQWGQIQEWVRKVTG